MKVDNLTWRFVSQYFFISKNFTKNIVFLVYVIEALVNIFHAFSKQVKNQKNNRVKVPCRTYEVVTKRGIWLKVEPFHKLTKLNNLRKLNVMGGGQSRDDASLQSEVVNAACTSVSVVEIINLMMPVYYTRAEISIAELDMVKQSWHLVLENKCLAFHQYRESKGSSCNANDSVEFFSINFY